MSSASTSAVRTTVHTRPPDSPDSWHAPRSPCARRQSQSLRPKVKQASSTRNVSNPRFPAIRTVASTELLVITPATTSVSTPAARNRASRSVPMKALLVRLAITVSPASGMASGLNSWPGWPGR